jgi:hypothetical protein
VTVRFAALRRDPSLGDIRVMASSRFRIWHCHTTTTRQPSFLRLEWLRLSRRQFRLIFSFQNSRLDFGRSARRQLWWQCQKQP